jgi:hypothetical protein
VAKRGEARPFTVRFRFEGQHEYARGSYTSREAAEDAARSQQQIVGPRGQTCEAWVVDRRQASR